MKIAVISALADPYYDYVKSGVKTWEIRLKKGRWTQVQPGEAMLFFRHGGKGEFTIVTVLERREYRQIADALADIGVENAIPQASSAEDALKEYRRFYSEEKERKYGTVAFRIKTIAEYDGELHKDILFKYLPHLKEECVR
ncbi:MAG: ASCH domain-containing protein [Candidatus Diapherotrites archaeon]|nr:ASCH domain-containing protein [Candidatus Diapherotrites archaeon]